MLNNFINLLAISVSSVDPLPLEGAEDHTKAVVTIVLIAIAAIIAILLWAKFDVDKRIVEARKTIAKKKADKARDEELARLHKIKEKNQRK